VRELARHVRQRELVRAWPHDDHHVEAARERRLVEAESLANEALAAVASDGRADLARRHDADPRRTVVVARVEQHEEMARPDASRATLDAQEVWALLDALGARQPVAAAALCDHFFQMVVARRARPLRRRELITLRPPAVAIRARKPCVRARRVLWG
jgi:hypothetical protein